MQRIGSIFTILCMVLIAGAIGVVLYLTVRLSVSEAATVAIAMLTGLAIYNTATTRVRDRNDVSRQIADLARGTAELARQVAEITRRVSGLDGKVEAAVLDKTEAAFVPVSAEIGELGALVKELAEQVAAHETLLAERTRAPAASPLAGPALLRADTAAVAAPGAPAAATAPERTAAGGALKDLTADAALALIRSAIEANRIDLYLQPIVTLPQRKVRFYEAMSRLRTVDGELIMPADFVPRAEAGGLMPRIDNLVLFRCVQVVRRLLMKNRDIGLFCNISAATLADGTIFPQLLEFMEANRALAPSLILELTHGAVRGLGPIESESLAALASRGFRFSIDNVSDLRMEGRSLSERSFRFVKAPADLLLNRAGGTLASDIHPADLADLLGRFGIDLVAEKIENETMVVDLLDHAVRFGQGFLFSPPRPVRPEALQGIAERTDVVALEAPAAGAAARPEPERPAKPETARSSGLMRLARAALAADGR